MEIRAEEADDTDAIRRLLVAAFPSADESKLVDRLRDNRNLSLALVGIHASELIAYIAFSPVSLNGVSLGVGLAPVAVSPAYQSQGYGAQIIEAGLKSLRDTVVPAVVVLGDPDYYRRFGFQAAEKWYLRDEYGGGTAFQAIELIDRSIPTRGGVVSYGEEFRIVAGEG